MLIENIIENLKYMNNVFIFIYRSLRDFINYYISVHFKESNTICE
jgi:hypothetical protein